MKLDRGLLRTVRTLAVAGGACLIAAPAMAYLEHGSKNIPEPATMTLLGVGIAVLGLVSMRRRGDD